MNHAFWLDTWQAGRIGFHEGRPNSYLTRHGDWLAGCHRILVPLCGKSDDLTYLAGRGHDVVGVELVEDAVRQFFAEHDTTPVVTSRDGFSIYSAGAITILAGDFFVTTRALVGDIDGIYDRAALVALPPELRARYVPHLRALAPHATRELLVSIEYPDGGYEGPPFSVAEAEVRAAYADAEVQLVDEAPEPRGRAGGKMIERCYAIRLPHAG